MILANAFAGARYFLLRAITALQTPSPHVGGIGKIRQLVTAIVGLVAIVVLPAILIYYARRRWRP